MLDTITVQFWHFHITHNHIRAVQLSPLNTGLSMLCLNYLIPRQLQNISGCGPEKLVVLDDENLFHGVEIVAR